MKLQVQYFKGIRKAEIEINKLTLVAGRNFQGKSSLALAAGIALTGQSVPGGLLKKDASDIINDNSKTGLIVAQHNGGAVSIEYPSLKSSATGEPLHSSPIAVGFVRPADLSYSDKIALFNDLLKPEPTKEELKKAVENAKLSDEEFESLWARIQSDGWEGTYEKTKTRGTESKGAWTHITGEPFGSKKAQDWEPSGWTPELSMTSKDDLNKQADKLVEEHNKAVKTSAVAEHISDELREMAAGLETAQKSVEENKKIVDEKNAAVKKLKETTPVILIDKSQPCPYCEKPLLINGARIIKGGEITKEDIKKSEKEFKDHQKKIAFAEKEYDEANSYYMKSKVLLQECIEANTKLEKSKECGEKISGRTVDEISEDLKKIKEKKKLIEIKEEAREIQKQITRLATIVNVLAPEGLKAEKLRERLHEFNTTLKGICKKTGWSEIEVKENLDIYFGERRYGILLSDSERYRVNMALQVAIADYDNSGVLVFDGADILDSDGRNGMVSLLKDRMALVCMTIPKKEQMPDFSIVGGNSYWVEEGEIK